MDYDKLRQISKVQQAGLGRELLKFVPILGTGLMAYDAYLNAKKGNWGSAALDAVGAGLGLIPGLGGFLGKGLQAVGKGATRLAGAALKPVAFAGQKAGQVLLKTPMMKGVPEAAANIFKSAKGAAGAAATKATEGVSKVLTGVGTRMNAIPLNPEAQAFAQRIASQVPKTRMDWMRKAVQLRNGVRANAIPLTQLGIHYATDPNMEVAPEQAYYGDYQDYPYMQQGYGYPGIVEEAPYIDPAILQQYYAQQGY